MSGFSDTALVKPQYKGEQSGRVVTALDSKYEGCRLQVRIPEWAQIITGENCRFIKTDQLSMTETDSGE